MSFLHKLKDLWSF